jgi:phosphoribosylaminoimidazole-succinocarboxamide synthase
MQMQREMAMTALEEQRAKVREINARAAKMEADAQAVGQPGMDPALQNQISQIQQQAADQLDAMSQQLAKAQSELANRTVMINRDADTKLELGRIDADAKVRVAEIAAKGNDRLAALQTRLDELAATVAVGPKV